MRSDRWILIALALLLVWLPLPWGSRSPMAMAGFGAAVAALAMARLALAASGRVPLPQLPAAARGGLALWLAWVAWVGLQLVPLPPAVLALLSPRAAEAHAALAPLGGGWHTTSLMPGATFEHWLLSLALLGTFWLVLAVGAHHRRRPL